MENKEVQIGNLKVKVLREVCIGAASCVAFSPSVFELDADRKAVIIEGGTDTSENLMMAAQSCPVKASVLTDATTGEQVWPK